MKILFVCLLAAAGTTFAQDSRSTGWIVIPVSEYGALRARAFPVERAPDGPPVEATLTHVDYELRIDGEIASGRATLTVDALQDGWVRETRIAGKLVSLVRGDKALSAMLAKRGRSLIELDIALPVASSGGEERLVLPASASGVTRASLAMTRADVEVKVAGGLVTEHTEAEGETRWVAFARGNEALAEVTVVQGESGQFALAIPPGWEVTGATGATLESSEMQEGALLLKVNGTARAHAFLIAMERPVSGTKADVSAVSFADAQRETGEIVVEGEGTMELTAKEAGGVKRMDSEGGERVPA